MITFRKAKMKKRSRVKARIKGTLIFLIILAALGAAFYFGYYQFQLPADTYGVIFTKWLGSGWDPEVVVPATHRIEWEGLLPTNLKLEKFTLTPRETTLSLSGELPSANIYSSHLEGSPDFSYKYNFLVKYTIKPEALPELTANEFLREETLDEWYDDFETALVLDGIAFLNNKSVDDDYMAKIAYNFRLMEADLLDALKAQYTNIEIITFIPVSVKIPDLDLYREGKKQYLAMNRYKEKINREALERTADRLAEESAKIELLNKYGEIFSKYPELINYYALYREDGVDLIPAIELPDITD